MDNPARSAFLPAVVGSEKLLAAKSQTLVEDSIRGRVGGALITLISAANITSMGLAGVAAAAIGTRNVFLLSGALVVLGVVAYWLFGDLRSNQVTAVTGGPGTRDPVKSHSSSSRSSALDFL